MMRGQDFWRFGLRWLPLCGILMPPVDGIINAILAGLEPHYNALYQWVSDLGAADSRYGQALSAWWMCFVPLFTPFALAVYAGIRRNRFGWVTPALFAIFGISLGLCGVFRCTPNCASRTFSTHWHFVVSDVATGSLLLTPFFFWLAVRHDERWRRYRWFTLVMQVAGVAALIALGLAAIHIIGWHGVVERTFWGVYYVWLFVIALKLLWLGWSAGTPANAGTLGHTT